MYVIFLDRDYWLDNRILGGRRKLRVALLWVGQLSTFSGVNAAVDSPRLPFVPYVDKPQAKMTGWR